MLIVFAVLDIIDAQSNSLYKPLNMIGNIIIIIAMLVGIIFCLLEIRHELASKEVRYSTTKYKIETEVIEREEVSNTTYVITRK